MTVNQVAEHRVGSIPSTPTIEERVINMLKFKTKKQKLREECWNVNWQFVLWLNQHLKIYKDDALHYVDLEYHKFEYQGQEYTQLQLIDKLIEITDWLIADERYFDWTEETSNKTNEMLNIFVLIFESLWW